MFHHGQSGVGVWLGFGVGLGFGPFEVDAPVGVAVPLGPGVAGADRVGFTPPPAPVALRDGPAPPEAEADGPGPEPSLPPAPAPGPAAFVPPAPAFAVPAATAVALPEGAFDGAAGAPVRPGSRAGGSGPASSVSTTVAARSVRSPSAAIRASPRRPRRRAAARAPR